MSANEDQIAYWNGLAGEKWVANQERLDRIMTPLTEALLQIAAPHAGERALDVGCGCGDLSLRVADAVAPGGSVVGIDISAGMLAHAETRATARGPGRAIEWVRADAMTHAFEPEYDLVTSRFGVMFFDDRRRAFDNLRRAVKPERRIALMAWRGREEVEWFRTPLEWIAPILTGEPTDGEIGPFALADGEATRELLADSGFRDVVADPVDRTLLIGDTIEDSLAILSTTGPAAALIRDAEEGVRAEALALMTDAIAARSVEGRLELRAATWVFRGLT